MRKHPVDVLSLVAGLLFVAIGGIYLVGDLDVVDIDGRFVAPTALMIIGLGGLAVALRGRPSAEDVGTGAEGSG